MERLESRPPQRAVGAGARHRLVFIDRLLATHVHLRHGATHDVLACWFSVDRSTITRAIGEARRAHRQQGPGRATTRMVICRRRVTTPDEQAGEPYGPAAAVGAVPGQRDRIPEQRSVVAQPFAHADTGVAEPVEQRRPLRRTTHPCDRGHCTGQND
ncbi:transposase family protein [Streptomyces sp. NPDC008265]|uniref:helix-turn-helix domain-containing protein n=1 Tax=Streptomyces sp. NPDC008265 TaxID=3364824 RepID=UPI0036EDFCF4